jgi:hypothetical protein
VVYVPTYYPTVVYGSSWYYPYYYYPPMYAPPPPGYAAFSFAAGVFWGAAIWGGCSWGWGHSECNIQVNNYNKFVDRTENIDRRDKVKNRGRNDGGRWQHSPEHRQGVRYRDQNTSNRFGNSAGTSDRMARDQARGRPSQQPAGGGANRPTQQPAGGGANRPTQQPAGGNRPSTQPKPSTGNTGQRSGSFSGASKPSTTRAASSRGSASRGGGGGRGGGGRR